MRPSRLLVALLAWVLPALAMAGDEAAATKTTLRLCTTDAFVPPYITADGQGTVQLQLQRIVPSTSLRIEPVSAPRVRCMLEARSNKVDGMLTTYAPDRAEFLRYPMNGTLPNEAQALVEITGVLYRRTGDASVSWDGKRLVLPKGGTLGVQHGYNYGDKLSALRLPVDAGAQTTLQLLRKLALGRHGAVIVMEKDGARLVSQEFSGQLELLQPAFSSSAVYLAVTPAFLDAHRGAVMKLWAAIAADRARELKRPPKHQP